MRAILQERYGAPERVLGLDEIDEPPVGDDDVLVQVLATSVNTPDWITVAGVPYLLRLRSPAAANAGAGNGRRGGRRGRRCQRDPRTARAAVMRRAPPSAAS
jgi:hypothetical protein